MEDKNPAIQENYLCSYYLQIISRFDKFWSAIFKEKVISIEWDKLKTDYNFFTLHFIAFALLYAQYFLFSSSSRTFV